MDFESVGSDMENAVWNETAETNYFKMMMEDNQTGRVKNQDNMDDSVAGGETLASVMNGGNNNGGGADADADTIDGYSLSTDVAQLPNETMSIVGVEDDVSTIANDTVNETTRSFFSGNGSSRADSKPRIRLFKEYITPEKKHKNKGGSSRNSKSEDKIPSGNTDNDNDDDETLPETPPGMIRVPGQSTTSSYRKDEGKVKSISGKDEASSSIRTKRIYIIAGVLALVLFASIIALGVALKGMRGNDNDNNNSSTSSINSSVEGGGSNENNIENDKDNDDNILDIWPDLDAGIDMDDSPITEEDDLVDASNPTQPSPLATSQPVPSPTDSPIDDAAEIVFNEVLDLLISRGIVNERNAARIESDIDSPQYLATDWLSRDPTYYEYLEDRVIQRWVLSLFAFTWAPPSPQLEQPQQRQRRMMEDLPQGWLTYTDECTWFASSKAAPCNDNGMYERIDIQDLMLGGYLPSELSLLSNSLKHIVLDGNGLEGSIPTEFSDLSNLESLRLRRNNLNGQINIDFDLISNLKILELGKNQFTGRIPDDLLGLVSLTELHLDYNLLSSDIPWDIGDLDSLVKLALSDNNLTGWVPSSLSDLRNLQVLTLGNNDLTGSLPKEICRFKNMEVLSVDCDAQGCECCTECAATPSPTARPTPDPTLTPTTMSPSASPVTMSPSASPTKQPLIRFTSPPTSLPPANPLIVSPSASPTTFTTSPPTNCVNAISVLSDCYVPSVDVEVSLTNCEPDSDDWVGLFLVDEQFDSNSLQNPNIWSWACGTRNCREEVNKNLIPVSQIHAGNGEWPLEPGTYVAVLARNSAQPYTAYAVSEAFIIEETCSTPFK